jgi:hypothetical protein
MQPKRLRSLFFLRAQTYQNWKLLILDDPVAEKPARHQQRELRWTHEQMARLQYSLEQGRLVGVEEFRELCRKEPVRRLALRRDLRYRTASGLPQRRYLCGSKHAVRSVTFCNARSEADGALHRQLSVTSETNSTVSESEMTSNCSALRTTYAPVSRRAPQRPRMPSGRFLLTFHL